VLRLSRMRRSPTVLAFVSVLFIASAVIPRARAQYMFLTSSRDGRDDDKERLPRDKPSDVCIWLDTSRNRDETGDSPTTKGIAACEFVVTGLDALSAEFIPAGPSKVVGGPLTSGSSFWVRVRCTPPLRPGRHPIGPYPARTERRSEAA
jgi:hypothetical protein